jgi:hypothetical protein
VKPLPLAVNKREYVPGIVFEELPMLSRVEDPAPIVEAAVFAVTPAGAPATDTESAPVNVPFTEPQETCALVDWPTSSVTLAGFAERAQLAGTVTTRDKEAFCVTPPPLAVTLNGYVPAAAVFATVRVSMLEPPAAPLIVAGENAAATPAGCPVTVRATTELKPFCGVMETKTLAALPASALTDVAPAETVNEGAGMITVIGSVAVFPAPAADTARV